MGHRIEFQFPPGEVHSASLNETYKFRGKTDTYSYVLRLILSGHALERVQDEVRAFCKRAYRGVHKPATAFDRAFKTTPDGEKTFIVFRAGSIIEGRERKVPVFDAGGNLVKRELSIGPGSILKVNGSMISFDTDADWPPGVAFGMSAIQVIKYVEFIPGCGFDPVEGFRDGEVDGKPLSGSQPA